MSNARNLARLLPNASGQLPTDNFQDYSIVTSKLEPALALQVSNQDLGSITASADQFSIDCGTLV